MLRTASLVTQNWASLPSGRSYIFLTALLIWLALSALCILPTLTAFTSRGGSVCGGKVQDPSETEELSNCFAPWGAVDSGKRKKIARIGLKKKNQTKTKTPTTLSELEKLSTSLVLLGDTQKENTEKSVTPWVGVISGIQNVPGEGIRGRQILKTRWSRKGQEWSGALQNTL